MKKTKNIVLSAVLLAAISSCDDSPKNEWTDGKDASGHTHDTAIYHNGGYHYYRYYGGGWYILNRNNMINTCGYAPASAAEIARPSFAPRAAYGGIRTGGFGGSAGESAGE